MPFFQAEDTNLNLKRYIEDLNFLFPVSWSGDRILTSHAKNTLEYMVVSPKAENVSIF